ncbi:MAG: Hpt domain-containing protein [Flavobacteriaceae bacterium]|nr:Hpt domain-containing protein [Flavobacteriaceae bacterium]
MEEHYKLDKIRELADNDQEFIETLAMTFLEEVTEDALILKQAAECKDYLACYKAAHKMKPTIDLFGLGVLNKLIEVQDWGKYEQRNVDISQTLAVVLEAIDKAKEEIKEDFNL